MTIVVTGASGHVGNGVLRRLRAAGLPVVGVTRDRSRVEAKEGVRVVEADFARPEQLARACENAQALFLVSLPEGEARLEKHHNVLRAAAACGVEHVVYLSFLGAAPEASVPQQRWHAHTEAQLANSRMRWTVLRPSLYQEALLTSAGFVQGPMLCAPAGAGQLAAVSRDDVAAVAAQVLLEGARHAGAVLEVTGPKAYGWDTLAQLLRAPSGGPLRYHPISDATYREHLRAQGRPEPLIEGLCALFAQVRAGRLATVTDTVSRVGKTTARSLEAWAQTGSTQLSVPRPGGS